MTTILATLIPVAALIALGNILRRRKFLDEKFWEAAERLVFFVLFPCLLFNKTANADMADVAVGPMASVLLTAIVATAFATVLAQSISDTRGAGFAAVFQGAIQQNAYIGFAVASGLLGLAGDVRAAIAAAVVVPLVNAMSIVLLARLGKSRAKKKPGWTTVPVAVVTNPLIIALALGWIVNGLDWGAPPLIDGITAILGQGSLPLALLCVGAGLRLRAGRFSFPGASSWWSCRRPPSSPAWRWGWRAPRPSWPSCSPPFPPAPPPTCCPGGWAATAPCWRASSRWRPWPRASPFRWPSRWPTWLSGRCSRSAWRARILLSTVRSWRGPCPPL